MAKISIFASHAQMSAQSYCVCNELGITNVEIKEVNVENIHRETLEAVNNGTDILVSRGYYALQIRKVTNCPLVEARMLAQELAVQIYEAKQTLNKQTPFIAIIGFSNFFCDISHLDKILGVRIKLYLVNEDDQLPQAVEQAYYEDHADFILGGAISCGKARELGLAHRMFSSSEDSLREALQQALKLAYISDLEKKNAAEWSVLLEYSFNGIIRLNMNGEITALNPLACYLMNKPRTELIGKKLHELIDSVSESLVNDALNNGEKKYSIFFSVNHIEIIANLIPVIIDKKICGAVFSCMEIKKIDELKQRVHKEHLRSGFIAEYTFEKLLLPSPVMRDMTAKLEQLAHLDTPLLLIGQEAPEKDTLAQSIHNASSRKQYGFLTLDSMDETQFDSLYFPNPGTPPHFYNLLHKGTLYIRNLELLSMESQKKLLIFIQNSESPYFREFADFRLITSASKNLWDMVNDRSFIPELYYLIAIAVFRLPSIESRKEDLVFWFEHYICLFSSKHLKYIQLTQAAKKIIYEYPWQGGLEQIKRFCQSLVVNSSSLTIHASFAEHLLKELYPLQLKIRSENPDYANTLMNLMNKYNNNRTLVAKELGISRSTLWRHLKELNDMTE